MLEPETENSRVRLNETTFTSLRAHLSRSFGYIIAALAGSACTAEWINQKEASFVISSADFNLENSVERSRCTRRVGRTKPKRLL